MQPLNRLFQAIFHLFKEVGRIPRRVEMVFKLRQRQIVRNENEAERLDRIRNPSKYLGK